MRKFLWECNANVVIPAWIAGIQVTWMLALNVLL